MEIPKGTKVLDAKGKDQGVTTGGMYPCRLEGCSGQRLAVRWPDRTFTYPCTEGMTAHADGTWQIVY